jgi:hypothetical protein
MLPEEFAEKETGVIDRIHSPRRLEANQLSRQQMRRDMSDLGFSPEEVLLEANIKEFGHTISMICALETGGKITADEAYALIKKSWSDLKSSRKVLLRKDERKS